jgi:hypothetical protein
VPPRPVDSELSEGSSPRVSVSPLSKVSPHLVLLITYNVPCTYRFDRDLRAAILMQIPTGALQIVTLLLGIWITNKFKMRWPVLA